MENRDKLNEILIDYNRVYFSDKMLSEIFKSEYNCQAIEFLLNTKTKIKIDSISKDYPNWQREHMVNKYRVTLKNKKHSYEYEFFDSIKNTKDNNSLKYDFYSVLAGMGIYTPDSFDEFCSEFGYEFKNESEYIKTKSIHLACLEQNKNLRKLFTVSELDMLSEIN